LRIRHDKQSGTLYIKLREGQYDPTEDFSERADVYLDVDADGNVLGLEALSFENLAIAVEERGGELELLEPPTLREGTVVTRSVAKQASDVAHSAAQRAAEMAGHSSTQAAEVADKIARDTLEALEDKARPYSSARSSQRRR
jgi:uncharacterized protein YuzE